MSEETRHRFNRLYLYTILFAFLTVTMTFVIFSSVAQVSLSCSAGSFVNFIGTTSDSCGPAMAKCNSDPSRIQCGIVTCTTATGGIRCQKTVTFAPAFAAAPKVYTNVNPASAFLTGFTYANIQFLAPESAGQTMMAIPAGVTEIFGDTAGQHEQYVDMSIASSIRITVVCTGAPTINAVQLASQFSYDNGANWHFLIDPGTDFLLNGLNAANGGVGDCGSGGSGNVMENVATPAGSFAPISHNVNASTPNLSNLLLRFVTYGGSGIDAATFTEIKMEIHTNGFINPNNDVLSGMIVTNAFGITASQFNFQGNIVGFCGCTTTTKVISGNWTAIAS